MQKLNKTAKPAWFARTSALALAMSVGAAGVALAQAAPDATDVGEVVVTASRVQAAGFTAPTPTSVITAAEVERTAPIQISEVLRTLVPSFRTSGATSTPNVYANLRGVGAQRTLVLVDGRRHVPTQADGTLDLNVIPTALVQRAEVVTGGASASWGSDAVTGVVNLILNTKLEGLQGSVQGGISHYGDAESFAASIAGGHSFMGGKLHIIAGAEYSRDNGIGPSQFPDFSRPWTREDRGSIGNAAFATNGLPGTIYSNGVRRADVGPGGLITNGPLRGLAFLPGGGTYPFQFGQLFGANMIGGENGGETISPGGAMRFPFTRYTAMTHAEYEFNPHITGFVEGTYAHSLSSGPTNPWRNQGTVTGATSCTTTSFASGIAGINVNINNPYLPAAVRTQMQQAGVTCFSMGRSYRDIPTLSTNDGSPYVWRGVAGLRGDLIAGWTWDAYYQYGKTRYQQRREHNLNLTNGNYALDAVVNPANGQIVCRITLTNPSIPCAPLNLFGTSSITPAALAFISGTTTLDQDFVQQVGAFNVHGSPFSLWAGPITVAAGGEYRKESINAVADPISEAGLWGTGNRKGAKGEYNVKEVYGEAVVPLLRDMPFAKAVDLNGAVRYTDYSSSGGVTTWKVGLTYDVNDELRFRSTLSQDIRAGNLSELFTASQTGTVQARDPRTAGNITFVSDTRGNPTLAPERARTFTAGAAYQPAWLPGARFSVDYYRIYIKGAIGTLSAQNTLDLCYLNNLPQYCALVQTTNNQVTRVILTQLNLNKFVTGGLDIEASYRTPLSRFYSRLPGSLNARVLGTYTSRLTTTPAIGSTIIDPSGQYTSPHWTVFTQLGYTWDKLSVTVENQYYSGGKIDNTRILGQISTAGANINHVGSTIYTNLTLQYDLPQRFVSSTQIFLRINNLFDVWPPFPNNGGGLFDEVGTSFRAGVRFKY